MVEPRVEAAGIEPAHRSQPLCCCCPLPATVSYTLTSGRVAYLCDACLKGRPRPCVYFIRSGGLVKIGYSARLEKRLSNYQTHSPVPVDLWHVRDGDRDLERELHQRFAADRERGEWFRISDAITSYVEGAA